MLQLVKPRLSSIWEKTYFKPQEQMTGYKDFSTNEARNKLSVIPHFPVILTGLSISEIILFIQGHLQGQSDHISRHWPLAKLDGIFARRSAE